MKIVIHQRPPAGFTPTAELRIFSPVEDPSVCVLSQRHVRPIGLVGPAGRSMQTETAWVAVQTERVDKITISP